MSNHHLELVLREFDMRIMMRYFDIYETNFILNRW